MYLIIYSSAYLHALDILLMPLYVIFSCDNQMLLFVFHLCCKTLQLFSYCVISPSVFMWTAYVSDELRQMLTGAAKPSAQVVADAAVRRALSGESMEVQQREITADTEWYECKNSASVNNSMYC